MITYCMLSARPVLLFVLYTGLEIKRRLWNRSEFQACNPVTSSNYWIHVFGVIIVLHDEVLMLSVMIYMTIRSSSVSKCSCLQVVFGVLKLGHMRSITRWTYHSTIIFPDGAGAFHCTRSVHLWDRKSHIYLCAGKFGASLTSGVLSISWSM